MLPTTEYEPALRRLHHVELSPRELRWAARALLWSLLLRRIAGHVAWIAIYVAMTVSVVLALGQ